MIEMAKKDIREEKYSCIVVKNNEYVFFKKEKGISPLINLYNSESEKLKEGFLFDRIIGKAAAMIAVKAGCIYVYGEIISHAAIKLLEENNIKYQWDEKVEVIKNRKGDGMCPIEESVFNIDDPSLAIDAITKKVEFLKAMAMANKQN